MGRGAIVMAAGFGTRMKSSRHKVLHEVCGKPMILHILEELQTLSLDQILVVVGQHRESVDAAIEGKAESVYQSEQLGTGHAVQCAVEQLRDDIQSVVILCGDTPLVRAATIEQMYVEREKTGAAATLLTADVDNPTGLGRIVLAPDGSVQRIVEEKDATPEERHIRQINAGIYAFDSHELRAVLKELKADNAQREYYLTDTLALLRQAGKKSKPMTVSNAEEVLGVNDRVQLAVVESVMRKRIADHWMHSGVTILDPASTYIGSEVTLEPDVVLLPGTYLEGNTHIGRSSVIGPNTRIQGCQIGAEVEIQYSVVLQSTIDIGTHVGPFAYVRPGSRVGKRVKVGDFVELKNAVLGDDTKVSHLAYVGDAELGKRVNYSCGAVTVNYDGKRKYRTVVGDDSFIGCNVNLIAPVTVGNGAFVSAGSTVSDDVPDDGFAIARAYQVTKENYVAAWKQKREEKRD